MATESSPEAADGSGNSRDVKRWLKDQAKPIQHRLHRVVLASVLAGALFVAQAYLIAQVLNALVVSEGLPADLHWALFMLPPLVFLRSGVLWLGEQWAIAAATELKADLRQQAIDKLMRLGPGYTQSRAGGALASQVDQGIEALEGYYARYLPQMSIVVFLPLVLLAAIFPHDWVSGLVLLAAAPLIPLFMILVGKGTEQRNRQQWRQLARLGARFLESVQGLTTLKIFGASRRELQALERISEAYRRSTMGVLRLAFLSSVVLEFFAAVSIAVVAVLVGFRLMWGEMAFLPGLFVLLLAPEYFSPLRNLGTFYHDRLSAVGAAEPLVELLAEPEPERPARTEQLDPTERQHPPHIQWHGVSYRYPGRQEPAVQNVDLEFAPGTLTALVGPSGAGKSTLAYLLLGFADPNEGRIQIDGHDLTSLDRASWWQRVAWIPQEPHTFSGTVLDNIRLGNPQADPEACHAAARKAQADTFIRALPGAYEAQVGDGGQSLSGGQRQRLALARAFLKDPPLFILDEPTARLDVATEETIQTALGRLHERATVLVIAHRLATVEQADRIVVVDNGRIVQTGDHDSLRDEPGLYRELVRHYRGEPVT